MTEDSSATSYEVEQSTNTIRADSLQNLARIQEYLAAAEKALDMDMDIEQITKGLADNSIEAAVNQRLEQLNRDGLLIGPQHFSGREAQVKDLIRKLRASLVEAANTTATTVPQPDPAAPTAQEPPKSTEGSDQCTQQIEPHRRGTRRGGKKVTRRRVALRHAAAVAARAQQNSTDSSDSPMEITLSIEQQQLVLPPFPPPSPTATASIDLTQDLQCTINVPSGSEQQQPSLPPPSPPTTFAASPIDPTKDHQYTIDVYRDIVSAQHEVIQSFRLMNAKLTEKLRKSRLRCSQVKAELFMMDGRITSSESGDSSDDDSGAPLP